VVGTVGRCGAYSDGEDEFGEGLRVPMPWIDVGGQFVMTAVEILDGGVSHADLASADVQRQIGDGRYVDYTTWSRDGYTMLGRLQMNEDWAAPGIAAHWMLHFAVDPRTGIDAAVDRVLDLGGWGGH
jgi:hypothetical protein